MLPGNSQETNTQKQILYKYKPADFCESAGLLCYFAFFRFAA